jgi:hypothetical protein
VEDAAQIVPAIRKLITAEQSAMLLGTAYPPWGPVAINCTSATCDADEGRDTTPIKLTEFG